jgi:hypothetical protein
MSVVISELEHFSPPPQSAPQGSRGSGESSGGSPSAPAPSTDGAMIHLLRREMSRLARLWAD